METDRLPRWARELLARHPGEPRPSPAEPVPAWLEEELRRVPLWYHIRGAADDPRFSPPYHLIEDVKRQPELLGQLLGLESQLRELAGTLAARGCQHLVLTGCGSAYYNSILGAFLFPRMAGVTAEAVEAWEFYSYYEAAPPGSCLLAQSATGGSFEVIAAARKAREMGMYVLALTNTEGSPLEAEADVTFAFPTHQRTGPDISVIPTRLLMMYLMALELGRRRGSGGELRASLEADVRRLPELVHQLITRAEPQLQELAQRYHGQSCMLVVGGGPNWFTALEAALKMEEESSTPCRTYQTADYPHMAISLLAPDRTTVVFSPPGPSYDRLVDCVRTAREGGSPSIAVVVEGDGRISREADDAIVVPGPVGELAFPVLGTVVGQLYGYYLGLAKGFNPDCLGTDDLGHARAWLRAFPLGTH